MFECDEDLGLDEELFTQEDLDNFSKASNNTSKTDQISLRETNQPQKFPKYDNKQESYFSTQSTKLNDSLSQERNLNFINTHQGNSVINQSNFSGGNIKETATRDILIDSRKRCVPDSEGRVQNSANAELKNSLNHHNFTKPGLAGSRGNYFMNTEFNNLEQNSVFEDDDYSDVFSDDIKFDVEKERLVKCPKVRDKKGDTPCKRKFPGPAGILPESPIQSKSFYGNDGDEPQSNDISVTQDFLCTQDNTQFSGQLWLKMCSDFASGPVFLPDLYNIAMIKSQAKSKAVHGRKFPFLAAIIIHLKKFDSKTLNTIITLKDASGQINASLHSDLYELHKQDISVGSVIVLREFSVLALNTSANIYITVTPRNLLFIYSAASLRQESQTQSECTQYTTPKITNVQDVTFEGIIEDTLNFSNSCQSNNSRYIQAAVNCNNVENENLAEHKRKSWCSTQNITHSYVNPTERETYAQNYHNIDQQSNFKMMKTTSNYIPSKLNQNNEQGNCKSIQFQQDNSFHSCKNVNSTVNNTFNAVNIISNDFNSQTMNSYSDNIPGANKQIINFSSLKTANKHCLAAQNRINDGCFMDYQNDLIKRKMNGEFSNDNNMVLLKNNNVTGGNTALIQLDDIYNYNERSSKYEKLSKIDINVGKQCVDNTGVLKAENSEETNKRSNWLDQFRFKKRNSDEKENSRGDNNENNMNDSNTTNQNEEFITSTQISVLSKDQEHSQILEEAFEGIDACSLFEEF